MAVEGVAITWYGHGTWGMTTADGVRVIVDPWFENPKCPEAMREPEADVILLTHGHFDHITDAPALSARTGAPVLCKYELAMHMGGQGVTNLVGFNTGGTAEVAGLRVTMTQAQHSGGISTGEAIVGYGGEPSGFVVRTGSGAAVYFAGDTAIFGDMALIGELYRPDIAVLPIGDFYTMGPFEAAHAVRLLGVQQVVGGHWGTFDGLPGTPAKLRDELAKLGLGSVTVHDLEPGGTLS